MTTTKKIELFDCDGESCGYFEPIRSGETIGWQVTDERGNLLGLVDGRGRGDDPFAAGNRQWELCEETPAHTRALQSHANSLGSRIVRGDHA